MRLSNGSCGEQRLCVFFPRTLLEAGGAHRVIALSTAKLKYLALFLEIYNVNWHTHFPQRGDGCLSQKTNHTKHDPHFSVWSFMSNPLTQTIIGQRERCVMPQGLVNPLRVLDNAAKFAQGNRKSQLYELPSCCIILTHAITLVCGSTFNTTQV